jgi:hypothetical protein
MFSKIWQWLNRPDDRDRYPDGGLVKRMPFPGGWIDNLPLWIQRSGAVILQVIGWLAIGALVLKICWPSLW